MAKLEILTTVVIFIASILCIDQDISLFCLYCLVLLYGIFDFHCYMYA